ncbi:MAG: branched-chain amino acid ABC transporter permease [Armatimonadota bacterium]|nr:branched-chain amino acid ABC transporter permease [Armatimonadota bacterium]MDR7585705.1 branched-chain amino acid ABC transporter permease [Armatimonadota bacterium]
MREPPRPRASPTLLAVTVVLGLGLAPRLVPLSYLDVVATALVLAPAVMGLHLLHRTGLISFGHGAFFGLGAYAGGFLYTFWDVTSLPVYLAAGVAAASGLGAAFGALVARVGRSSCPVLTLALGQIVHALFVSGAVFRLFGAVGQGFFLVGTGGLFIPRFPLAGPALPEPASTVALYYTILTAVAATGWVLWRVDRSPFGLALRAVGANELRAACTGVPVRQYRWATFVISAGAAGLGGALSGQLYRQITPQHLSWLFSAQLVFPLILGGTARFSGPLVGTAAFVALQEVALRTTQYRGLVLGAAFVALARFLPHGLTGVCSRPTPVTGGEGARRPDAHAAAR